MAAPRRLLVIASDTDEDSVQAFIRHLALAESHKSLVVDTAARLAPGADVDTWRDTAIATDESVLLVLSPDFFADTRLVENVLPKVLDRVAHGLTLFLLPLRPCLWDQHPGLARHEALLPKEQFLSLLPPSQQEEESRQIVKKLLQAEHIRLPAPGWKLFVLLAALSLVGLLIGLGPRLVRRQAASRPSSDRPDAAAFTAVGRSGFYSVQRADERNLTVLQLPSGHGLERGRWLGLFRQSTSGDRILVGYGTLSAANERSATLYQLYLDAQVPTSALMAALLPSQPKIGKALGAIMQVIDSRSVRVNLGESDGVQSGTRYRVLNAAVVNTTPSMSTLTKETLGTIYIDQIDLLSATALIVDGTAPPGALIALK